MSDVDSGCPQCGWTLGELRRSSSLGCPACVSAFRGELFRIQRRLGQHGSYAGSLPGRPSMDSAGLQAALDMALADDDFETAVILRERIKAVSGGSLA